MTSIFGRAGLSATAIVGLVAWGTPSSAATVSVYDLNIISNATPPIADPGTLLGTVTLTQINNNEVDVLVSLMNASFVSTGGPHNAFAFNLTDPASSITITSPPTPI